MKKILFAFCLLVFAASIAVLPSVIKWENFKKCTDKNWTDAKCDSCYYAIYHKYPKF